MAASVSLHRGDVPTVSPFFVRPVRSASRSSGRQGLASRPRRSANCDLQGHQDHGRVVAVGIEIVVVLEAPAARLGVDRFGPVARRRICRSSSQSIARARPDCRARTPLAASARTRDGRVPDRRLAGLQPGRARFCRRRSSGLRTVVAVLHFGAVVGVAEALQGHDAPDDRRIDRPQPVAALEAGEHPPLGAAMSALRRSGQQPAALGTT